MGSTGGKMKIVAKEPSFLSIILSQTKTLVNTNCFSLNSHSGFAPLNFLFGIT